MKKTLYLGAFLVTVCLFGHTPPVNAATFDPGRIIDDAVFTNYTSMNVANIQSFLNSKVPSCDTNGTQAASDFGRPDLTHAQYAALKGWQAPPYTCLRDYTENGKSAAQVIYDVSQQYHINPQVFIVLLQKETGLVTDTWPLAWQYRTATGYGCPDSTPGVCDATYNGYTNQVSWAGRLYRSVLNQSPTWYSPYVKGWNYIQWSPTASCGGSMVNVLNWSTAALYDYTPYQPNAAALSAGFGKGDSCSAYGNRNFFLYFTSWFGSTTGDLVTSGGGVYRLENGTKRAFPSELVFLSYSYKWADVVGINAADLSAIPDGPVMAYNTHYREGRLVTAAGGGVYLVDNGLKRPIPSIEAFQSWSYKWTDVLTITSAELTLIPDGSVLPYNVHYHDGRLVSAPSQGIYLVDNGLKRPYPSVEAFLSYSYKWVDVLTLTNVELSSIPDGSAMAYNTHYRDGKVISTTSQGVYLVENGLKRPFPSDIVFSSWSYSWSNVVTVSSLEFSMIPDGAAMNYNVHYRDGKLITASSQGVFLVENGLKRPFPSASIFVSLLYKWSDVITIRAAEMALIPDGTPMGQ